MDREIRWFHLFQILGSVWSKNYSVQSKNYDGDHIILDDILIPIVICSVKLQGS